MKTQPWSKDQLDAAVARKPHQSAHQRLEFLSSEFLNMIKKGQWMVLPYDVVRHLPNFHLHLTRLTAGMQRRDPSA
jgi:hypothetical protein